MGCIACIPPPPPDNMIGPVYRLMPHPQHSHLLLSAVEGNNEVSAWNMETGQKKLMLWGVSQAPPFSRSSKVREIPWCWPLHHSAGLCCNHGVCCTGVSQQKCACSVLRLC